MDNKEQIKSIIEQLLTEKQIDEREINNILNLLSYLKESKEEKNYYVYIKDLLEKYEKILTNDTEKEEKYYRLINNLIIVDIDIAKELLNKIIKYQEKNNVIKHLTNKIVEKQKYLDLTEEQKQIYVDCIEAGHNAVDNNNMDLALDYYTIGLFMTNHPIFYYYIGKMYYKKHNFLDAYNYLHKYNEFGGKKYCKSSLYLYLMEKNKENISSANNIRQEINELNRIFHEENRMIYEHDDPRKYINSKNKKIVKLNVNINK